MAPNAAVAARYSVRPLLPGPEEAVRDEVLRLGRGAAALPLLARHAAVEALTLRGLEPDIARILEREARGLGVEVVAASDGRRAVVMGPLVAVAELPYRLIAFGQRSEALGEALAACMTRKGARPTGFRAGDRLLATGRRTLVMGVVNVTPDSFSGDGLDHDADAAVARGVAMAAAGADLVDVGGESTRPHSVAVAEEEELRRVVPVVERLAASIAAPVSVDTRKAGVARAAVAAGATVVNDIWGLRGDPAMAAVCAEAGAAVVLMHNHRGTDYADLLEEVVADLHASLTVAERHGIVPDRIVVDPGIGFGKTPAQNLEVLRRLGELRGLGHPILVGVSRKSTTGLLARRGDGPPAPQEERLEPSLALAVLAVARGADVVRTHDVAATARALRAADAVLRGTPASLLTAPAPGPTG